MVDRGDEDIQCRVVNISSWDSARWKNVCCVVDVNQEQYWPKNTALWHPGDHRKAGRGGTSYDGLEIGDCDQSNNWSSSGGECQLCRKSVICEAPQDAKPCQRPQRCPTARVRTAPLVVMQDNH